MNSNLSGTLRPLQRAVLFVATLIAIFWILLYAQFTVDDAFIFFRYGYTLVHHHVWNWNPSGPRAEAYTSILYVLLSILPALLHISPVIVFKLFGCACVAAMGRMLWTSAVSPWSSTLAIALFLCSPYLWVHAFSCLETPLFMVLLMALTLTVCNLTPQWRHSDARIVYTLALLLTLTRPEGAVFSIAALVLFFRRTGVNRRLPFLSALIALALLYFFLSWAYFHSPLPNPFYVKVQRGSLHNFLHSGYSVKLTLLALLLCAVFTRDRNYRLMVAVGFAVIFGLYLPHNLAMNYCDRFVFQIAFPLILLGIATASVPTLYLAATALLAVLNVSRAQLKWSLVFLPRLETAHADLGRSLAPFAAGHSLLGSDMGVIPYYSDWISYDSDGLCTTQVARHGLTSHFLAAAHPDLILLSSIPLAPATGFSAPIIAIPDAEIHPDPSPNQQLILAYMQHSGDYVYIGSSRWYDRYVMQYLRTDTPRFEQIRQSLLASDARSVKFRFSFAPLLKQRYLIDQLHQSQHTQ